MSININITTGENRGVTREQLRREETSDRLYHEICQRGITDIIGTANDDILLELWDGDPEEAKKMLKLRVADHLAKELAELIRFL